ncbi:VanZ family protein [Virgibacillus halodenitrificans]|uniref:VanZ family protein n=1 Tax=Virgibacillus halodenitrificans TaxID=1482 RepID=UPI00045C6BD9|nr:VanZ family protein [Virgibacillus halodenitrificans]CDQ30850.1 putative integral membrane protein [Virgibacillus halodenitrificans]
MKKYTYWLLPIGWMGIIFYSSHQPYEKQDIKPFLSDKFDLSFLEPLLGWIAFNYHHSVVSIESRGVNGFIEFFLRKGAHVTVFFILCLLFYLAWRKSISLPIKKAITLSFLLTIAYAILDELHQGFTPNRTPYAGDVALDGFGAFLAVVFIIVLRKIKLRITDKK